MENTKSAVKRSKGLGWFVVLMTAFAVAQTYWPMLSETRTYRDLTGATPFHGVRYESQITEDGRAIVNGDFVKRRCIFSRLTAYTTFGGSLSRAIIDTSADDGGSQYSRPPSRDRQRFGPWVITSLIQNPDGWEIYVRHECPEGDMVTLFAKGLWR